LERVDVASIGFPLFVLALELEGESTASTGHFGRAGVEFLFLRWC
jgi:hypothetical protein